MSAWRHLARVRDEAPSTRVSSPWLRGRGAVDVDDKRPVVAGRRRGVWSRLRREAGVAAAARGRGHMVWLGGAACARGRGAGLCPRRAVVVAARGRGYGVRAGLRRNGVVDATRGGVDGGRSGAWRVVGAAARG